MIRVIIEMIPCGDEARRREIERFTIANVDGDEDVGTYEVNAAGERAHVVGHRRADGARALVARALGLLRPRGAA